MRLAHDSDNSDTTGGANWFGLKKWCEFMFVVLGKCTYDLYQFGCLGKSVLLGDVLNERLQHYFFPLLVGMD